jgi:Fur family ferric uptake transcriptional regulator
MRASIRAALRRPRVGRIVAKRDLDTQEIKDRLRTAGLRATTARTAVLGCLLDAEAPLTHAEVCDRLLPRGYDRATLYRNLVDLTEAGLVLRSDHGDHLWRFELAGRAQHEEAAHAHFVCSECGEVSCLPGEAVDVKPVRGLPRSVRDRKVEIQLRGLCNGCE